MTTSVMNPPRWATASLADPASNQPIEVDSLGAHLRRCAGSQGRWFGLECAGETLHNLIAPRLVTTLAVASLLIAAGCVLF